MPNHNDHHTCDAADEVCRRAELDRVEQELRQIAHEHSKFHHFDRYIPMRASFRCEECHPPEGDRSV